MNKQIYNGTGIYNSNICFVDQFEIVKKKDLELPYFQLHAFDHAGKT